MKTIKFNLQELMADAEKDETVTKAIHKTISQDSIAELLKKTKPPDQDAHKNSKSHSDCCQNHTA